MNEQPFAIQPARTAVVIMDFQAAIVANYAADPASTVARAASVLDAARAADIPVIYVVHRGGPFEADSPDVEIHSGVTPQAGEDVLRKTRAGSFSTTGLDVRLRELGRDTLVLFGVATSGCVLSTVRGAADLGYEVVVVKDACSDRDDEVHRVLTEKIFPRQASVVTADEFVAAAAVR